MTVRSVRRLLWTLSASGLAAAAALGIDAVAGTTGITGHTPVQAADPSGIPSAAETRTVPSSYSAIWRLDRRPPSAPDTAVETPLKMFSLRSVFLVQSSGRVRGF